MVKTNIRERLEINELKILSPLATKSIDGKRDFPIEPCPIRTSFQRDRDRILHCKSFRRMKHKTQVFLSPEGDHYRTRLTHTLEVSQIARTVARALRLNEDLTEAIALGHDLGHTPYGHAGERALDQCSPVGYNHAAQSVRVIEKLENNLKGLNLTEQVRDGIGSHSEMGKASTLEGRLVFFADKIAYMNHDTEDAIMAGIINENDIPWQVQYTLGRNKSERITTFVMSLIENSTKDINMSNEVLDAFNIFNNFLFEAVYKNPEAKGEETKVHTMLTTLYEYFYDHPQKLSCEYQTIARNEGINRAVCDYIAGMTDTFSINIYKEIFIPRSWGISKIE